jgi:hypothetical protein
MTRVNIKDLEEMAKADLEVSESCIEAYSMRLGAVKAKWLALLEDEKLVLAEMDGRLMQMRKKLHKNLILNNEFQIAKNDIETYIKGDEKYSGAMIFKAAQECRVNFIEGVMNILANQSYLINNAVKMIIFKAGG